MNRRRRLILVGLSILIIISIYSVGTSPSPTANIPPNEYSENFEPLVAGDLGRLEEISVWDVIDEIDAPVSLIEYNSSANSLAGTSDPGGLLFGLGVETGERLFFHNLSFPDFTALTFDEIGENLFGSTAKGSHRDPEFFPEEYMGGFAVWDVNCDG